MLVIQATAEGNAHRSISQQSNDSAVHKSHRIVHSLAGVKENNCLSRRAGLDFQTDQFTDRRPTEHIIVGFGSVRFSLWVQARASLFAVIVPSIAAGHPSRESEANSFAPQSLAMDQEPPGADRTSSRLGCRQFVGPLVRPSESSCSCSRR